MICITCGKNEAINDYYEECEGCIDEYQREKDFKKALEEFRGFWIVMSRTGKIDKLVEKFLSYFEKNMSEVLLDYIIMTWFIGQDDKIEKKYKKLRQEIIDESRELSF